MAARIVAILSVQWGLPGDRPARWFRINPLNHSGRRLIRLIGHDDFTVTNACSDIVYSASAQGTPDAAWLRRNLRVLRPEVLLVCGSVAQRTFTPDMVSKATRIIELPHPAARLWSKKLTTKWARKVQRFTNH